MPKYAYAFRKLTYDTYFGNSDVLIYGRMYLNKQILVEHVNNHMITMIQDMKDDDVAETEESLQRYHYNPITLVNINQITPTEPCYIWSINYDNSSVVYSYEIHTIELVE